MRVRGDGLARPYSIASVPEHDRSRIELHVRLVPGGRMSGWLVGPEIRGAGVRVRGPPGDCFYVPGRRRCP